MNVVWGECLGIDIGYCFEEIEEDDDCLVMQLCSDGTQIDCTFLERELLDLSGFHPKPFGCWRIKK